MFYLKPRVCVRLVERSVQDMLFLDDAGNSLDLVALNTQRYAALTFVTRSEIHFNQLLVRDFFANPTI